jgi:transposase-like protein
MEWPSEAVEEIPAGRFRPRFCPWPACPAHRDHQVLWHRHGFYIRRCDARRVPRFRCHHCGRTFSQQSFALSYYLKRPELTAPIARGLVAGSAHRQIARSLDCHHATVTRRSQRLGRHAHLLHHLAGRALPACQDEAAVVDDFDSFAGSQYFPCTLPTAVGSRSWFVYGFAFARERRRGRMSPSQRRRRARLEQRYGRPPRGGVRQAFRDLIGALPRAPGGLRLLADDDPAIRQAVQSLRATRPLTLEVYPNPRRGPKGAARSPQARARDRAMFPNDQLHRFLRHTEAAHRRETIAFGRSYNGLLDRLALFVVWRNLVQPRSERHPGAGTSAMRRGLTEHPWSWEKLLAQRLQPSRVGPPESLLRYYRRDLVTPGLRFERRHDLRRAF